MNLKSVPMSLAIFLCLVFQLTSPLMAQTKEEVSLTISQDEAYAESEVYSQIRNFVLDSLSAEGIKLNILSLPLERANILSSQGEIDGQLARVADVQKAHPKLRSTKLPYVFVDVKILYLKSQENFEEKNLQKYRGAGLLNNQAVSAAVAAEKLKFTQVSEIKQVLTMLQSKRVDYVIMPDLVVREMMKQDPKLKDKVKISQRVFVQFPLHFILNEKRVELFPRIKKALREGIRKNRGKYPLIRDYLNTNF